MPVRFTEAPAQIVLFEAEAETVGSAFTVIATLAVFVQPFASVPVTEYVVLEPGETVTDDPLSEPGIQL